MSGPSSRFPDPSRLADAPDYAVHLVAALEASGLGTWEWNLQSGTLWWSPNVERAHGLEPGAFEGTVEAFEALVDPLDLERLRSAFEAAVRARDPFRVRYRAWLPDGSRRWMELTGAVGSGPDGRPRYMTGLSADITGRIRTEHGDAFLAEAAQILSGTMDYQKSLTVVADLAVPDLADWCVVDLVPDAEGDAPPTRHVFAASATPEQMERVRAWGRERTPRAGLPFGNPMALVTGEAELVVDLGRRLRAKTTLDPIDREIEALGIRSFLSVPLRTEGRILGALTLATSSSGRSYDREDLRRAHRLAHHVADAFERALYHSRAQQAIAVRNEVLAIVSHDLRNPLNNIHMASTLLREQVDDPTASQRLDAIDRAVDRAAGLIRDLLDVARAEMGSLSIETAPTRVGLLLREARSAFSAEADAAAITLTARATSETDEVMADQGRILQVLSNLVSNALRHTPRGGAVALVAERHPDAYHLCVRDNGPGVPPAQRPFLFRPFSQPSSGPSRGAAGLGLAIARAIVHAHGGSIWLDERHQPGAAFCFSLPHARTTKHSSGRMAAIDE